MDGIPLQELPTSLVYIDGLEIEIESSDYNLAISDYQGDEENDKYIYLFYASIMFS